MDFRRLDSFIFDKIAGSRLPGLSLALVKDGALVHARGFGQRDLERGLPATPETLYSIGSVTKSFTALAIFQLAERGLLDVGDPVERFLPFPHRPGGEIVTLEHLLCHSSGIPALAYSEALIGHANGTGGRWLPIAGPEDVLTFMADADDWVESRPGERWAYLNEGFALLGLIVEKVSGKPYGDFIRENILAPLGMSRSVLDRNDVEAADDVAVPYVLPEGERPYPGTYLYRRIRSEGGLISSVMDLSRYLTMFLSGGSGLVSAGTLERMMAPHVAGAYLTAPDLIGSNGPAEPAQHYGYGLATESFLGRTLVGHGGSVLVSTAHLAFLPSGGLGVAVLANGSGYPLSQIAKAALAVALGEKLGELPQIRLEDALNALTGRYETYRATMTARVERNGNFLELHIADRANPKMTILVPEHLDGPQARFYTLSEGRRLPVTFRRPLSPGEGDFVAGNAGPGQAGPGSATAAFASAKSTIELMFERYKFRRMGPL
jgi:CubicO group peptidase (beta-lactamase class C family)